MLHSNRNSTKELTIHVGKLARPFDAQSTVLIPGIVFLQIGQGTVDTEQIVDLLKRDISNDRLSRCLRWLRCLLWCSLSQLWGGRRAR